jgi:hypothetical protein
MRRRLTILLVVLLTATSLGMIAAPAGAQQESGKAENGVSWQLMTQEESRDDNQQVKNVFQLYNFTFDVVNEDDYPKIPFPGAYNDTYKNGYPEPITVYIKTGPFVLFLGTKGPTATLVTSEPVVELNDSMGKPDSTKDGVNDGVDYKVDDIKQGADPCPGSGLRSCELPTEVGIQIEAGSTIYFRPGTFCVLCFLHRLAGNQTGQIEVTTVIPAGGTFSWASDQTYFATPEAGTPAAGVTTGRSNARMSYNIPALNPGPGCPGKVQPGP